MDRIVSIVFIALAVFLLVRLLLKPLKWILKLLLNTLGGFLLLIAVNFVGSWVGLSLGLNWINALVAGLLGLPGVALLLVAKLFLPL